MKRSLFAMVLAMTLSTVGCDEKTAAPAASPPVVNVPATPTPSPEAAAKAAATAPDPAAAVAQPAPDPAAK